MRLDLDKSFKLENYALVYTGKRFEGTLRDLYNLLTLDATYTDIMKDADDEKIIKFIAKIYHDLQYNPVAFYEPVLAYLLPNEELDGMMQEYQTLKDKVTEMSREYHSLLKEEGLLEKHIAEVMCIEAWSPTGLVQIPCGEMSILGYYGWQLDLDKLEDDPDAWEDEEESE